MDEKKYSLRQIRKYLEFKSDYIETIEDLTHEEMELANSSCANCLMFDKKQPRYECSKKSLDTNGFCSNILEI